MHRIKRLAAVCASLWVSGSIFAQEATEELGKVLGGSEQPELSMDAAIQVILYLALMALLGAGILFYVRRGGRLISGKARGHLQVEETHMLGNKQYLVVVRYKEQKMLLGVGNGFIRQLCYLDQPFDPAAFGAGELSEDPDKTPLA